MGSNDHRSNLRDNDKTFLSKIDFSNLKNNHSTANLLIKDNYDSNQSINKISKLNNHPITTIGNSNNYIKTKKKDDLELEKIINTKITASNIVMTKMMSYDIKQTVNDNEKLSFLTT